MRLVVYTAATVLLAERLRPVEHRSRSLAERSWKLQWDRAIELLNAYSRVGQSAQRCVTALGILSTKIQGATLQSHHQGDEYEAWHAPDVSTSLVASGESVGFAVPDGLAFQSEFSHPDFNIDDMFWLNTSAADIFSWENSASL